MPTWPSTLPAPRVSPYQMAPVDPCQRTDMEVGAARSRRRTLARNDRVSVAWVFSDAQMTAFRAWFEDDAEAAGGAAWFYALLAVGNGGNTSQEARFVGIYQASFDGLDWAVTATLEVR